MALILDGIDGTGSDPVDLSWQRRTIVQVLTEVRHTVEVLRCLVAESSCHTVLILIEVAELILTKLETQILGVHLGNFCMFEL